MSATNRLTVTKEMVYCYPGGGSKIEVEDFQIREREECWFKKGGCHVLKVQGGMTRKEVFTPY